MAETLVQRQERVRAFSTEYARSAPRSVCTCGHTGDGANSDHAKHPTATGSDGHGACTAPDCDCKLFTWAAFLPEFYRALK